MDEVMIKRYIYLQNIYNNVIYKPIGRCWTVVLYDGETIKSSYPISLNGKKLENYADV